MATTIQGYLELVLNIQFHKYPISNPLLQFIARGESWREFCHGKSTTWENNVPRKLLITNFS